MAEEMANVAPVSSSESPSAPAVEASSAGPSVSNETSSSAPAQQEKMLSQEKVNEIVGRTRVEERLRATREVEARYKAMQSQQTQQSTEQAPQQSMGGVSQMDEERVRQVYREEAERQALGVLNNRIATDFVSKLDSAKSKYQDFDAVTEDLKIMNLPMNYVHLFNEFDNAADMLYDLGKNPEKLGQIVPLFYDPALAKRALRKLSDSIRTNEAAVKQPKANPPLSQISASPTGVDNGKQTVSDLRKQSWLKA